MKGLTIFLLFWTATFVPLSLSGQIKHQTELVQLKEDLQKVWPLAQTVKIEFELALAQAEFLKTKEETTAFWDNYEQFVKDNYFKKVLELNIRQGKLLLLLIDRELGKTSYDLLKEYRSAKRANYWQNVAKIVGADLKEKYNPSTFPEIEQEVKQLCNSF
jgi:hypothetical protein